MKSKLQSIWLLLLILTAINDSLSQNLRKKLKDVTPLIHFSSNATSQYKYNSCVISRVRDVDYLLEEWLEFHMKIGVGHFFIADDCSTDNGKTVSILEKYESKGVITLYRKNPHLDCDNFMPNTSMHLDYMFHLQKNNCKWMMSIDPDEYLFPSEDTSELKFLDRVLTAYESTLPVIRVAGYIMRNNGDLNRTTEPLIFRYPFGRMQPFIKTIVLSKVVENWYSAHFPEVYNFTWNNVPILSNVTNINFGKAEKFYRQSFCPLSIYPIYLRHFKTMSLQDYRLKQARKYEANGIVNRYHNTSSIEMWSREKATGKCPLPGRDLFIPAMLKASNYVPKSSVV